MSNNQMSKRIKFLLKKKSIKFGIFI